MAFLDKIRNFLEEKNRPQPVQNFGDRLRSFTNTPVGQGVVNFQNFLVTPNPQRSVTQPGGQGLAQKAAVATRNYFNPESNGGQNFWSTNVARGLGETQRFINNPPRIGLQQYSQNIQNPLGRTTASLGLGVAENLINTPQRLLTAGTRLGENYRTGGLSNPRRAIGTAAQIADPLLDLYTLGGASIAKGIGKEAFKLGGKQGIKTLAGRGAVEGGGWGAIFGTLNGLAEGEEAQLKNALFGGAVGIGAGAVLGGGLAGATGVLGKASNAIINAVRRNNPNVPEPQVRALVKTYIRDRAGKFAKGQGTEPPQIAGLKNQTLDRTKPIQINDWMSRVDKELGVDKFEMPQPGLSIKLVDSKKPVANAGGVGDMKPEEVKRVADNLIRNNTGLQRKEAEAIARDVIRNRPFNDANAGLGDIAKGSPRNTQNNLIMAKEYGRSFEDLLQDSPAMLKGRTGFDTVPQTVKVYRGSSKTGRGIESGDWVTTNPEYAKKYGGVVEEIEVPAKDLRYMEGSAQGNAMGQLPEYIYIGKSHVAQPIRQAQGKQPQGNAGLYDIKALKQNPNIVWHETNAKNVDSILRDGFKTGKELNVGEHTDAVYFSGSKGQKWEGAGRIKYGYGKGKTAKIPLDISKLKLLDRASLKDIPGLPSYKQPSYLAYRNAEDGIFPEGYDGLIKYNKDGSVYELALRKDVATSNIVRPQSHVAQQPIPDITTQAGRVGTTTQSQLKGQSQGLEVPGGRVPQLRTTQAQSEIQQGADPYGGIIPQLTAPKTPLALPGKYVARTPAEAKRLFKKTGKAPELDFSLKDGATPIKIKGTTPFYNAEPASKIQLKTQQSVQNAQAKTARAEFEEYQKAVFKQSNATRTTSKAVNDLTKAMKGSTRSVGARDVEKLKDISSPAGKFKDVFRNFKTVYGEKYNQVKETILDPLFVKGKQGLLDDQEKWIKKISGEVEGGFGIKKGTQESADVQKFGEKLITADDLIKKYGSKKADTIIKADKWFRQNYDQLLDEVNAVRAKIYPNNPDKIIPKRSDYYRHFQELSQGIDGLLNTLGRAVDVSPQLAGISYKTNPKSKWLSFAQKRLGAKTEYDAVGGFIDYVKAQTYAKHIDPHIDTFRQLSRELGEVGVEQGKGVNNFSLFLEQFADDLSGKTNSGDRFIQEAIGRKPMAVVNWINQRVKANVILGNASSALAQPFNLPNGIAEAGPKHAVKGIGRALASIYAKNKPMDQSTFIRERYFRGFDKFDRGMINDGRKFAAWMITALDEVSTKAIWNMQYDKALAQKISNPVGYADDVTRRMVGGRGIGEMPLIQRSKLFQVVAPFQLEVTNAWHVIGDMVGEKAFGKLMTLAISSYVMNRAVEQIRGSDVSFDPIQATVEGVEAFNEEDGKKIGALRFVGRTGGEVLSNLPLGQTAAAVYPEYGNKDIGLPPRKDFFGKGDPTRFGGTGLPGVIGGGLQDPLFKVIPPYGGQQIKRFFEGIDTNIKGYSESKTGKVRFPITNTPARDLQRAIFGQFSSPEAREYFDEKRSPLGDKQSEVFKNLPRDQRGGLYSKIIANREGNKAKDGVTFIPGPNNTGGTFSGSQAHAESTDLAPIMWVDDSGTTQTVNLTKKEKVKDGSFKSYKEDTNELSDAVKIYHADNNQVTREQKLKAYKKLGYSEDDIRYHARASFLNSEEQAKWYSDKFKDHDTLIKELVKGRVKSVGGEYMANQDTLKNLRDAGLISSAEYKYINSLKLDKKGNPIAGSSKGGGRGKKGKTFDFRTLIRKNTTKPLVLKAPRVKLPTLKKTNTTSQPPLREFSYKGKPFSLKK
jgi:hypothetical protein